MTAVDCFENTKLDEYMSTWWSHYYPGVSFSEDNASPYGVLVLDEGKPIMGQYIYPASGCKVAWLGFTVRDPSISAFKAGKAIKMLMDQAEKYVKFIGYRLVCVSTTSPAIQKASIKRGYAGEASQELWRRL